MKILIINGAEQIFLFRAVTILLLFDYFVLNLADIRYRALKAV